MNQEATEARENSAAYKVEAAKSEVLVGYKNTEAGIIPEEWEAVLLGDLFNFKNGLNKEKQYFGQGTPIVNYMDVFKRPGLRCQNILGRVTLSKAEIDRFDVKKGDVFFTRTSETVDEIGTSSVMLESPQDTVFSGFVLRGRPVSSRMLDEFKQYSFETKTVRAQIVSTATYTTRALTNGRALSQVWIPLPTEYEQRAIATALSDVDALLDELDRLIAKKRDIKQATMQQLLTGQTRLPGFEGEWEERSLLEIAEHQKALFDDGDWVEAEHITDQGVRLVQTGNIGVGNFVEKAARKYIYEKSFERLKCKELKVGDILICRLADPAGRACILPDIGEDRIITSVDVTIFRPRPEVSDRNFLVQFFSTKDWFKSVLDNVGGTTHKRISRGALGKLKVPFPPFREQQAIAKVLLGIDADIEAIESRRDKTAALKKAMMQDLLTGRARLITQEVAE